MKGLLFLACMLFAPAAAFADVGQTAQASDLEMSRAGLLASLDSWKPAFQAGTSEGDTRLAEIAQMETGVRAAMTPSMLKQWESLFKEWVRETQAQGITDPGQAAGRRAALMAQEIPESLKALNAFNGQTLDAAALAKIFNGSAVKEEAVDPRLADSESLAQASVVLPRFTKKNSNGKVVFQVTQDKQREIARIAAQEAQRQGMDPLFVLSFIGQESGYYTRARGAAGELGLMQIMPQTAVALLKAEGKLPKHLTTKKLEKILFDPDTNIHLGVTLLKQLQDGLTDLARRKHVNINKVLAAGYNAGQPAVVKTLTRHKRTPLATKDYEAGILKKYSAVSKRVQKASNAPKPDADPAASQGMPVYGPFTDTR